MTEDNWFRDYAGPGRDSSRPPASGPNGAKPSGEETGATWPPPGGPGGTRPYENGFADGARHSGNGSGGPGTWEDDFGGTPPGGAPGAYYSEWTANDPTARYRTLHDDPEAPADPDAPADSGERPDDGPDDWPGDRRGSGEDAGWTRPRGPAGRLYETFSDAFSGLGERLRSRRRPAPGPAEVHTPPRTVTGAEGYRVPIASRPFLWCAGTDPDLVPNRSELYRYSTIGIFVCLVALVATTMFAIFASVVNGEFSPAILPFAVIWGVVIFWVDRSIVAEPAYGKVLSGTDRTGLLDPVGTSRKPGWLTYLMRLILAVGVSFIIAEAVTLLIFQSEVKEQLAFTQTARTGQLDATFKAADEDRRRQLDVKYNRESLCAESDARRRVRDAVQRKKQDEEAGKEGPGLSGDRGVGRIAANLKRDYDNAQREYRAAQRECDAARKAVTADLTRFQEAERAKREAERLDVRRNTGWVAQEKALHEFIRGSDSPIVSALPWVLRVTILVLDLLPLSVKLLGGPTVYERRLREQAYSQAYETQRLRDSHIAKIDMRYDLDQLKTRDRYDRGRADIRDGPGRGSRGTRKHRNRYF